METFLNGLVEDFGKGQRDGRRNEGSEKGFGLGNWGDISKMVRC